MDNQVAPLLIISSDFPSFDPDQLHRWAQEGYRVNYIHNARLQDYQSLADDIESNELYAIIGFGAPALHALQFATSPISHLAATIAYYPPALPTTPPARGVRVLVHLVPPLPSNWPPPTSPTAGSTNVAASGIIVRKYMDEEDGDGHGGCKVGFAEMARGSGVYRRTSATVAYTRDLELLRRVGVGGAVIGDGPSGTAPALGTSALGTEDIWERFMDRLWGPSGTELVGRGVGIGSVEVRFGFSLGGWEDETGAGEDGNSLNTASIATSGNEGHEQQHILTPLDAIRLSLVDMNWKMKLLNRTVGVNRVVDEVVARFTHNKRMEWILPGVEGTGKKVVVGMVIAGGLCGGKVRSLRIYWDRGAVRRQVKDG
ncbi:hypothetical protein BDZ91DRAFT_747616 [Kalaharituber pfeilii]|nr:hypothetical protein BDZ91DRAFT_747616 [Kalaharituber pfeilii]